MRQSMMVLVLLHLLLTQRTEGEFSKSLPEYG
jgi:hypothetical protein